MCYATCYKLLLNSTNQIVKKARLCAVWSSLHTPVAYLVTFDLTATGSYREDSVRVTMPNMLLSRLPCSSHDAKYVAFLFEPCFQICRFSFTNSINFAGYGRRENSTQTWTSFHYHLAITIFIVSWNCGKFWVKYYCFGNSVRLRQTQHVAVYYNKYSFPQTLIRSSYPKMSHN